MNTADLHAALIALQPKAELERKWTKAQGRHSNQYWTQEWLDLASREGAELAAYFNGELTQ